MANACREWRERIGLFAVGDLEEGDRIATEAHLEGCPMCRAEAESLRAVATLLTRVDPARIEESPAPAPADLGGRVAALLGAERRTSRRRLRLRLGLGFAGAAALAAAAVLAIGILGSSTSPPREVEFTSLPSGVEIAAQIRPESVGTRIGIAVHGLPPGIMCRVALRRADGSWVPAGSFRYGYGDEGDSEASLTAGVRPDHIAAIRVRADGRTFVQPLHSNSAS